MSPSKPSLILGLLLSLPICASSQQPPDQLIAAATAAFPEYDQGPTFDAILNSGDTPPNPILIARTFDPTPGGAMYPASRFPSPHITQLVSRSDFVGIGIPLKRWTYPLDKKSFTVSIYLVHLTSVTIPGKDGVGAGRDVFVARAGGPIQHAGHNFRAIDPNFQLFHLNEPYLFFATKLQANLYKVNCDHVLKENEASFEETSQKHPHQTYFRNTSKRDLLEEVFAAWTQLSTHPQKN